MSRILKVMIVLLAIAAMVTPVMAEDRLSLNGQMRVRGFYIDDDTDSTQSLVDQRLRTGGKYSIAEGVSVTFRFDVTEATWGSGTDAYGLRRSDNSSMQWDRAHLDLDFGSFKLRAGQIWAGAGVTNVVDAESNGIQVIAGPVKAFVMLTDDQGSTKAADDYLWAVTYGQKIDTVKFDVVLGGQVGNGGEEVYLVSADVVANLDALTLTGELDYFTGDASSTQDAMGTQLYIAADFAATETVTVGGKAFYALAADTDEAQYTVLGNNFSDWKPLTAILNGNGDIAGERGQKYSRPFSAFESTNGAGVIGINANAKVKATEALSVAGSVSYLMPEDDDMTTTDSAIQIVLASSYEMLKNAYLNATVQYTSYDETDNTKSDNQFLAGVGLFVNF